MKYVWLILFFALSLEVHGQKLTGFVTDKAGKQPISGALITCGNDKTHTDSRGQFEIALASPNDSLRVSHFGYKTYSSLPGKTNAFLHIELQSAVISLNIVTVHGTRNFTKDSLENRTAYAKQFNYTGPTVADAFKGGTNGQPFEFISVNPLILIAALTKKNSPEYKFKKMLIGDEHEQYVDEKFNKGNVSRITGLKGDTLLTFLTQYRPTYQFVLKATDYEMEIYIKESLEKFKKDGVKGSDLFRDVVNKN